MAVKSQPSSKSFATRTLPDGRVLTREQIWPEMRARYEAGECGVGSLVALYGVPKSAILAKMVRDREKGIPWIKTAYQAPIIQKPTATPQSIDRLNQWRQEHFERYDKRFADLREILDKVKAKNKDSMSIKESKDLLDAEKKLHEMERTHLGLDQVTESREGLGDISSLGLFDGANITIQPAAKAEVQAQIVEVESHVTQEPS